MSYRYSLHRCIDLVSKPTVCFIMLNPSTADEVKDDATIRKCKGFADRTGFGHLTVANLFAYRATDPHDLFDAVRRGVNIIGPGNDDAIADLVRAADAVVYAWGGKRPEPVAHRASVISHRFLGRHPLCLGKTRDGWPRHPLMLRYRTPFEAWSGAL